MDKNRRYHVKIVDTETGKVVMDRETSAVFALVGLEEGVEAFTGLTHCSLMEALSILWSVDSSLDGVLEDNPVLKAGYALRDRLVNKTVITDVTALEGLK